MQNRIFLGLVALLGLGLYGCEQNQSVVDPASESSASNARLLADSSGFHCRDSLTKIDVATLPAAVKTYITTTYAGATIQYAAQDDKSNFLVAITQNNERKTLLFNADGSFNKELALRPGKGGPHGGPGGSHGKPGHGLKDSLTQIAPANLPAAITTYITTNYAGATIAVAAKDDTRGYLVMITQNNERKTLLFNTDGTFSQEVQRKERSPFTKIDAATLPAAVKTYVTTNYATSTIVQAGKNGAGQFAVWVQASGSKPVTLLFAADGAFIQVLKPKR